MVMVTKTWGWVKVIGGAVAVWFAWQAGIGANLAGAVAILGALAFLGGLNVAMGKK